jgi:Zn-finger nucleic acid-binding protein
MELFDRRRYYFCRYCGTFEFIEGSGDDGIHVLQRPADARPCPLCAAPLAKSLLDETHSVEYCEKCRGVLIERSAFAAAVMQRRARASGPGSPPAAIDGKEVQRRVTCSACSTVMDVHPYYGPGNVIIDTCRKCDLVWLDFGELRQIDQAPGDDRGRAPRVVAPAPVVDGRLGADRSVLVDAVDVAGPSIVSALFDIFT